jgi:ankyrin repeat protein
MNMLATIFTVLALAAFTGGLPGTDARAAEPTEAELTFLDAAMDGDIEMVKECLAKGVDVNATYDDGTTAMMQAAAGGYPELIRLLLKSGSKVNAKNDDGVNAFLVAADQCAANGGDPDIDEPYYAVLRLLAKAGADMTVRGGEGYTAMEYARHADHQGLVKVLTELGAS